MNDLLAQDGDPLLAQDDLPLLVQNAVGLFIVPGSVASIDLGRTQAFSTQFLSSDGSRQNGSGITWSATHGTISSTGFYTASGGSGLTETITATDPATGLTATLSFLIVPIVAIVVSPTRPAIPVGGTELFVATITWANGDAATGLTGLTPTWSAVTNPISNAGVYTGTIAAIDTVSATILGVTGSTQIGVVNAPSSSITAAFTFGAIDETCVLEITQTPAFSLLGANSSAPEVVSVTYTSLAPGTTYMLLTAISAGTASIVVADDAGQSVVFVVTVSV